MGRSRLPPLPAEIRLMVVTALTEAMDSSSISCSTRRRSSRRGPGFHVPQGTRLSLLELIRNPQCNRWADPRRNG